MSLDVFRSILTLAQEAGAFVFVDALLLPLLALPPVAALSFSVAGLFLPGVRAAFRRALHPVRLFCGGVLLALFLLTEEPLPAYGTALLSWLLSCALAAPLFLPARAAAGDRAEGERARRPAKGRAVRKKERILPPVEPFESSEPRARRTTSPAEPFEPSEPRTRPSAAAGPAAGPIPPAYGQGAAPRAQEPSAYGRGQAQGAPMPALVRCYEEEEKPVVVEKDVRLGHIFSTLERLRDLPLSAGDRLEAQKTEELLTVYRAKGTLTPPEADTLNDILAALLKMMAKYQM